MRLRRRNTFHIKYQQLFSDMFFENVTRQKEFRVGLGLGLGMGLGLGLGVGVGVRLGSGLGLTSPLRTELRLSPVDVYGV